MSKSIQDRQSFIRLVVLFFMGFQMRKGYEEHKEYCKYFRLLHLRVFAVQSFFIYVSYIFKSMLVLPMEEFGEEGFFLWSGERIKIL